jgi:hypothetical protein
MVLGGCSSSGTSAPGFVVPTDAPAPIAYGDAPDGDFVAELLDGRGAFVEAHVRFDANTTCTGELVDECWIATCTSGATNAYTPLDAGALAVSSAGLGADVPVSLNPFGYGQAKATAAFADGESVELKGAGGVDFPAFDVKASIPAPLRNVRLHGCSSGVCEIPATGPVITWDGGAGASVRITFTGTSGTRVSCRFAGDPGKGAVPASVVAKMGRATAYALAAQSEGPGTKIVKGSKYALNVGATAPNLQKISGATP